MARTLELNRLLGMATRAEPPPLARKGHEKFMFAVGVGASHPGESLMQVAASQAFIDHFVLPSLGVNRLRKADLLARVNGRIGHKFMHLEDSCY
jgi:hypothetical protein